MINNKTKKLALTLALAALGSTVTTASMAASADTLTVYSYRQPVLIEPILNEFTKETGIKVELMYASSGIAERLSREGRLSPADLVLTTDFSRLTELADKNLVAAVDSKVLEQNIPAKYRSPDNDWYALTMRVRNVYSSKDRTGRVDISYEDLASPKYKGQICMRSGKHAYNLGLVASMVAHHGEAQTKVWLKGLKANLARKPQGSERTQVKAVKDGVCDLAIGNSYYYGKMLVDPQQKSWAESVYINFPNQKNRGSHINVSGVALTKYAPHKDNAVKLMEYLSSTEAQENYSKMNMEYPVKEGVAVSDMVASWGEFKMDSLPIYKLGEYNETAVKLLDEVKFDL